MGLARRRKFEALDRRFNHGIELVVARILTLGENDAGLEHVLEKLAKEVRVRRAELNGLFAPAQYVFGVLARADADDHVDRNFLHAGLRDRRHLYRHRRGASRQHEGGENGY